jgi:tetratricopeptide (TPR) repeat protein
MSTRINRLFVIVAAATVCSAALAQPTPEPVAIEPEQRLLEQLDELRSEQGVNAEARIEPLRTLALLYQEDGDHALAVVVLREARQILRANRGLFSATVDEALVLHQLVRSEKALRDGEQVWNLQHDMTAIARQHLDDMRVLPIFLELIDDRTERLDEFSTTRFGDLPPGIYVPCDTDPVPAQSSRSEAVPGERSAAPVPVSDARNCPPGTWGTVVERLRGAVLRNYADAIAVLIRNGDYASQELRDLEKQALSLPFERGFVSCSAGTFRDILESELVDSCLDPAGGSSVGGWGSLMRLVYYEVHSGAPATARASAYAELADWYVRAEHLNSARKLSPADEHALNLYAQAFVELQQDDDASELMAEIFSPELPVTLPTYAPNPLASMESSRYIDVSFDITKYGRGERIEILDTSKGAARGEERDLIRLIESTSFRPRFVDGRLADSAPVVVRYALGP